MRDQFYGGEIEGRVGKMVKVLKWYVTYLFLLNNEGNQDLASRNQYSKMYGHTMISSRIKYIL